MTSIEKEKEFLLNIIENDKDFQNAYKEYNKGDITFKDSILYLLDYIFYSDFNPYLDKKYLDMSWAYSKELDKIYNMDDIYEEYIEELKEV